MISSKLVQSHTYHTPYNPFALGMVLLIYLSVAGGIQHSKIFWGCPEKWWFPQNLCSLTPLIYNPFWLGTVSFLYLWFASGILQKKIVLKQLFLVKKMSRKLRILTPCKDFALTSKVFISWSCTLTSTTMHSTFYWLTSKKPWKKYFFCYEVNQKIIFRKHVFFLSIFGRWLIKYGNISCALCYFM